MYNYETEREKLFTDKGQRMFLEIRDAVAKLLDKSGAFTMNKAIAGSGDSWSRMACVERMAELGEIQEIYQDEITSQDRVLVRVK